MNITLRDCTLGLPSAAFISLHSDSVPGDLCPVEEDRIKSDTGMPYVDGEQGVQASIGGVKGKRGGQLSVTVASSQPNVAPGPRRFFFDFTDLSFCPPGETCTPPSAGNVIDGPQVSGREVEGGLHGLKNVGDSAGMALRSIFMVEGALSVDDTYWVLDFDPSGTRANGTSTGCEGSTTVTVTRTSATTWDITGGIGCLHDMGPDNNHRGFYNMPFGLTVEAQ